MNASVRFVICPSDVRVEVEGISAINSGARLEHCDTAFWIIAQEASAGQSALEVVLHPPDIYRVRLADLRGGIRAALSRHAPVRPDRLVWSAPHDGDGGDILVTIARRDRISAITAQLLAKDMPPPHFVDADGHALGGAGELFSRKHVTLAIVLAAMLSIPASIAVGGWYQRQAIKQSLPETAVLPDSNAFAAIAARPTLAASLTTIARALPAESRLVSVARTADGRISLEIDTADPDQLRDRLRAVPALAALRDEAQVQTADATYRVTYAVQQRATPRPIAVPASPPSTRSLRARIARDAETMAVSLELADSPAPSELIAAEIEAVGPQPAIIAFAERLETRPPAVRLTNWRIAADTGGVRLIGIATAPVGIGQ